MSEQEQDQTSWNDYYNKVADRKPRGLLAKTLEYFDGQTGFAVDLGCGAGVETLELLRHGWHVLAIDRQPEAIAHVLASVPSELHGSLETQVAAMESLTLPPADLVWASASLPFCLPEKFADLWHTLLTRLRPGGRFAGDFFGPRHVWASNPQMTFHSLEQVIELIQALEIEHFTEEEREMPTALQGSQHWHAFEVIARRK
jgi:SAM-dependent methyltransferase